MRSDRLHLSPTLLFPSRAAFVLPALSACKKSVDCAAAGYERVDGVCVPVDGDAGMDIDPAAKPDVSTAATRCEEDNGGCEHACVETRSGFRCAGEGGYTFADDGRSCLKVVGGDPDGDGVDSEDDNCPMTDNADRADLDGDGEGDACDPAVASPAAVSDPTSKPDRAWTRRDARLRVGVPLLAAGAGGLIAGWVLYADARAKLERRDDLPPVPDLAASADEVNAILKAKQRYADARAKPAIAFAGGALGAAAMPWLLPDDPNDPFPWYAWAAGAGGAGLAAVGFWQLSGHNACTFPTESGCQRREDDLPIMSVTFATALPLLAVPLTYALRMPFADHADAQVQVTRNAGEPA